MTTTRAHDDERLRPRRPATRRRRRQRAYWPGLDGMRAVAIAAVVAYHMAPNRFPGGFFGVDVFFVISGYLITSMLVREWSGRGHIDLKRFWWHRVRRLYPAAAVLIVLVVLIAALVAPATLVATRVTIPAVLFYVTNWWFIFHRVPYFEALGRPPLLLQFWSLAIEEQYYLIWPPILLLLLSRWRRPGRIAGLTLLGAIGSSVLMAALFHPGAGIDRVYYGSDTHSQGLLLGSALGLLVPPGRLSARVTASGRRCLDAAGLVALAGIITMMATVGQGSFTWRGGLVLVVVLAGVATIVAAHPASRMSRALAVRPLRWLGTRSYSVYLWHWPIIDLTRGHLHGGAPLAGAQLVLIGVAAELSYRLVEAPWRTGRAQARLLAWLERSRRHRRYTLAGFASVVIVIVAVLASASTPIPPELRIEATAAARARIQPATGVPRPAPPTPAVPNTAVPNTTVPNTAVPSTAVPSTAVPSTAVPSSGGAGTAPTAPGTTVPTTVVTPAPGTGPPSTAPSSSPITVARLHPVPGVPGLLAAGAGGPVLAIGDSVMLAASADLEAAFGPRITVDAVVGRQVDEGLTRLEQYRAAGRFDGLQALVVGLGSNGPFGAAQMERLLTITRGVPVLILVNVRVPLPWQSSSNATIDGATTNGATDTMRVTVVNWYRASAAAGVLYPDHVHPDPAGQLIYANLITRAITVTRGAQ